MRGEIENVKKILGFWEWVHVFLMLAVAAYLRFQGLGTLSFYGDEELSALAVQGILSDGYPHMPSGMAYWRGVPYSYLAAGSALLQGLTEFSIRMPSAFFGVLTIPIFYGLAKRLIGLVPASFAVWLLVLSSWHIDMSREARMYSMFLFCFLLSLYCFERGFIQGRRLFIICTFITTMLTFMIHQLGALLILFCWFAALPQKSLVKYRYLLLGMTFGVGVFVYYYRGLIKFDFPGTPVVASVNVKTSTFLSKLPYINFTPEFWLFHHILEHNPIVFGLLCSAVILATLYFVRKTYEITDQSNYKMALVAGSLAILSLLNLFGVILMVLVIMFLLKMDVIKSCLWFRIKLIRWMALPLVFTFLFWLLYGLFTCGGEEVADLVGLVLAKKVIKDSIYYPALHILVYLESFPVMTILMCLGSVVFVFSRWAENENISYQRIAFIWFWIPLFFLGFTREWVALRYTLPVYPFYIMIFSWTIYHLVCFSIRTIGRLVPQISLEKRYSNKILVVFFASMLIYPVVNRHHGFYDAIATSRLSYCEGISPSFHGFPFHPDHQGAGSYVKANFMEGDTVVAMDVQQQQYYVGHVDYWIRNTMDAKHYSYLEGTLWRCSYTKAIVIKSLEELQLLLYKRGHNRVWLITSGELTGSLAYLIPSGIQEQLSQWRQHIVFVGRDKMTSVYLFE